VEELLLVIAVVIAVGGLVMFGFSINGHGGGWRPRSDPDGDRGPEK
jgi:hypothetical protein